MNKKTIGIILCMLLVASVLPVTGAFDNEIIVDDRDGSSINCDDVDWWSMFCHDPQHTGYSTSTAPDTDDILWNHTIEGSLANWYSSSPAIVNDKLYIGWLEYLDPFNTSQKLLCLDAVTGNYQWNYSIGSSMQSSPAVADGKVYFGSGNIICLNALDGSFLKEYVTDGDTSSSSPAIADGKLYIASFLPDYTPIVYCLDLTAEIELWNHSISIPSTIHSLSSPVVDGSKVYVSTLGKVYCMNASNGMELWNYTPDDWVSSPPAVANGKVYFGTSPGEFPPVDPDRVYCIDAETGFELWNNTIIGCMLSVPAVAYDNVYISTFNGAHVPPWSSGKIYCLDASNGEHQWNYTTDSGMEISPVVADYKVYVGSDGDPSFGPTVYCLDAMTGDSIWNHTTSEIYPQMSPSPLAVADGKVFIGSAFGDIYCFRGNQGPDNPSPPTGPSGQPGEELCFAINETDPESDQVYYMWDWGDETYSGWLGPYDSGENAIACHTWTVKGVYEIRVKAKDIYDAESGWSEPLTIDIIAPEIEITYIFGGLGLVSAEIRNSGDVDATEVNWSIDIPSMIPGRWHWEGTIPNLLAGEINLISSDGLIFGLGKIGITVTVHMTYTEDVTKTKNGFVLIIFVIVI